MNKVIEIDVEKCIGCNSCVNDCVSDHLIIKNNKAEFIGKGCIECGHCYAICPTGAISMVGYEKQNDETKYFSDFDSEELLLAMKSRRTIRHFKNKPVEKEKIEKILEAGRYSPTAKNSQNVSYTVIQDELNSFENQAVKLFKKALKAASPFSKKLKNMEIQDNFFFKGAPLVIIVSGKNSIDASLASSYMEIIAESLGLGVLYSGFFIAASILNPKIRKMLELPSGHKPITCMVIGYPDVKYKRIVPRKRINVKYK